MSKRPKCLKDKPPKDAKDYDKKFVYTCWYQDNRNSELRKYGIQIGQLCDFKESLTQKNRAIFLPLKNSIKDRYKKKHENTEDTDNNEEPESSGDEKTESSGDEEVKAKNKDKVSEEEEEETDEESINNKQKVKQTPVKRKKTNRTKENVGSKNVKTARRSTIKYAKK
ncbi:DNA ligase 1-like isoform X2 [Nasonia vitripennis]|uniref:Uncharacterized protein n=1 Tax=Nasonia vitripennis TaxID=7425 RepID=A0A7M7Q7J7_NASVI|nr:DNA ligase 1-like isoform X2 [Nasonia vitripennis]